MVRFVTISSGSSYIVPFYYPHESDGKVGEIRVGPDPYVWVASSTRISDNRGNYWDTYDDREAGNNVFLYKRRTESDNQRFEARTGYSLGLSVQKKQYLVQNSKGRQWTVVEMQSEGARKTKAASKRPGTPKKGPKAAPKANPKPGMPQSDQSEAVSANLTVTTFNALYSYCANHLSEYEHELEQSGKYRYWRHRFPLMLEKLTERQSDIIFLNEIGDCMIEQIASGLNMNYAYGGDPYNELNCAILWTNAFEAVGKPRVLPLLYKTRAIAQKLKRKSDGLSVQSVAVHLKAGEREAMKPDEMSKSIQSSNGLVVSALWTFQSWVGTATHQTHSITRPKWCRV